MGSSRPESEIAAQFICAQFVRRHLFILGETDDVLKGFIEIKKIEISTDLTEETKATAQAVREAHILVLEKKMDTVAFVLTNSKHWSFAKASKYGTQIQINKIVNLILPRDCKIVLTMLKQVMQGTFWTMSTFLLFCVIRKFISIGVIIFETGARARLTDENVKGKKMWFFEQLIAPSYTIHQ